MNKLICDKCKKEILVDRQPYKHIGNYIYTLKDGYVYEKYIHINCNAKLLPKPKSFQKLCKELNKII